MAPTRARALESSAAAFWCIRLLNGRNADATSSARRGGHLDPIEDGGFRLRKQRPADEAVAVAFELSAPHHLDPSDARARLHALGDYLGNKYGLAIVWTGEDTATVSGSYLVVTISGTIELRAAEVRFSGKDPGMLWRGKAKDYLTRKLKQYLDPATPVESLPRG